MEFRAGSVVASTAGGVVPRPTGTQTGDLLLAGASSSATSGGFTTPAGWTSIRGPEAPNAAPQFWDSPRMQSWWRIAAGGDPATWDFDATDGQCWIAAYMEPPDPVAPIDVSSGPGNSVSGDTTKALAPSLTPVGPTLLVVWWAWRSPASGAPWATFPAGFTGRILPDAPGDGAAGATVAMADKEFTTTSPTGDQVAIGTSFENDGRGGQQIALSLGGGGLSAVVGMG